MYALTGDPMYKEKAKEVADRLLPAFQTPTGIPNALVNIQTGVSKINNQEGSKKKFSIERSRRDVLRTVKATDGQTVVVF